MAIVLVEVKWTAIGWAIPEGVVVVEGDQDDLIDGFAVNNNIHNTVSSSTNGSTANSDGTYICLGR